MRLSRTWLAASLASPALAALNVDFANTDSVKTGAQQLASALMGQYTGNQPGGIPGILPQPYYWWEAGAMFGAMVDYWYYTGDSQYNNIVTQAMQFQVGQNGDFMPQNQTKDEGNDDQSFWAMAALAAAEHNYPNPPAGQPSWISLAQAVFNTQAPRWDDTTCGGGLRWQIYPFNTGYTYKNTISNCCFFATAARLGRYTGNQTYIDWANKMWTWINDIGVMSADYHFYDGTDSTQNCSSVNHIEWTYNTGIALYGAAIMYNTVRPLTLGKAFFH
jgi:mannan endo-1,6-alpha-mannosidase